RLAMDRDRLSGGLSTSGEGDLSADRIRALPRRSSYRSVNEFEACYQHRPRYRQTVATLACTGSTTITGQCTDGDELRDDCADRGAFATGRTVRVLLHVERESGPDQIDLR